ncbi:ComEC/Rec2 family competence protein [Micromonospora sp. CPCC 206060]|uniref:ComEC/Rec2 family competence protein n=1 Tax=Micromonospora sp. CPCC 206060 TaxID=3122406 RepID=UPI002FF32496
MTTRHAGDGGPGQHAGNGGPGQHARNGGPGQHAGNGATAAGARPPDLRLVGLAVATWLSALAGLHLNVTTALVLAVAGAGSAVLLAVYLHTGRAGGGRTGRHQIIGRYGWLTVSVLLGLVCGAGSTAARLVVRDAPPVRALAEQRATVTAELVVRDDPRPVRGAVGRPATLLVATESAWLDPVDDRTRTVVPARVLVLANHPGWRTLLPGQRLTATGRLAVPRGGDLTAVVLSSTGPPTLLGRPSWAQRIAGTLRSGLQRACAPLPDEPGGLLPGLVVGDTSELPAAVEEDFRATGMTHLNAVSGSNVAIVVGLVLLLARWARAGPWPAAGLSALALVGFVILARPSPSVVRAATMGAIGLVALATGRPRAAVPALCAAVTVLVVVDPELAGDAGFALSVLATGGLLLLAPRWRDALRRRGVPAGVAEALVVPAAAQLACAPVVAGLSGTVSLVAVPANLLAVPAIAPATVLGVAAAVVSPVWPGGAEFAAWLGSWPAWWLVTVARYGAQTPAGTLPWIGGVTGALLLAAVTVALLVGVRHPVVRRLVTVVTVAVVVGALPVRLVADGWPPAGWVAVVCAVGQGDAVVLPAGAGRAVVVDAGPDPAAVDRCLRRLGVDEVPLLLFSHFHADHTGGVAGVFRGRRVTVVATPAWPEPAAGRLAVDAAATAAGTPVGAVAAGWTYRAGGLGLTVLGPPQPLRGTRSDPNNNSLVLLAHIGGLRILLAGDAETEEQRALLESQSGSGAPGAWQADVGAADRRDAGLRADVLKVAHHGSAYQDPAFLDAVAPAVALVSVGADNDYGHPSPSVLARLSRQGARVLRTDIEGDLAVVVLPGGPAVATRGNGP